MKAKNPYKQKKKEQKQNNNDCAILLYVNNGNLMVTVDLGDKPNPKMIGALVGTVATGEVVGAIIREVEIRLKETENEDILEEVRDVIQTRVLQHRQATLTDLGEDEPVVAPVNAIRRQLTMYQPQQG